MLILNYNDREEMQYKVCPECSGVCQPIGGGMYECMECGYEGSILEDTLNEYLEYNSIICPKCGNAHWHIQENVVGGENDEEDEADRVEGDEMEDEEDIADGTIVIVCFECGHKEEVILEEEYDMWDETNYDEGEIGEVYDGYY